MPRNPHPIWASFNVIQKQGNSGKWAQCKKCKRQFQGIPERLMKHVNGGCLGASSISTSGPNATECSSAQPSTSAVYDDVAQPSTSSIARDTGVAQKRRYSCALGTSNMIFDKLIVTTGATAKKRIDLATATFFYATNTPFLHADHPTFREMCAKMRPGYAPPSSRQIGGNLLDEVYEDTLDKQKNEIKGKTVSMSLDGWSNVHNDPIVCCSITTSAGQSILVDTIDTSGHPHTADYLVEVAKQAIVKADEVFNVKVASFVTDNAFNVTKMRHDLCKENEDVIQYGCSAHMLNLLAKDLEIKGVPTDVTKVVKYFRNKHLPASWYKASKGNKLVMPIAVRWNTTRDCIRSYLTNRGKLVQICQNYKDQMDKEVYRIVNDAEIANSAMALLSRLDPIAKALDRAQRDGTTISVAVEIWHQLEKDLRSQPPNVKAAFKVRRDTALGSVHYLANILDHRFLGRNLVNEQRDNAFTELNPAYMPIVSALMTKSAMFPSYLFEQQFNQTPPLEWWLLVDMNTKDPRWVCWEDKKKFMALCEQLLTAVASTAGLERIFSSFGLVHSKLRNRLGTKKAHKLVYMFKTLNQSTKKLNPLPSKNLEWIWNPDAEEIIEGSADEEMIESIEWDSEDEIPLVDLS